MLRFHGFLSSCLKVHKRSIHIPGFPYIWDKKLNRYIALQQRQSWKYWLAILSFLSIANVYAVWKYNEENDVAKFSLGMVSVTGLTVAAWLLWFVSTESNPCVKFLNGLLDMEKYLGENGLLDISLKGSYEGLMCGLLLLTDIITPWLLGIGSGLNPCSPPNLLVPFFQSCGTESQSHQSILSNLNWSSFLEFLAVSIANGIFWKAITEAGDLSCIHVLVGCISQTTIIKVLKRSVKTVGNLDNMIYRRIQILSGLFNESHVGILFVGLSGVSVLQTCFLHILFQVGTTSTFYIPVPVTIWCIILVAQMVLTILYMFGKAGSLHTLHKENIGEVMVHIARDFKGGRRMMVKQRMFFRSCAPVEVAFGVSNFVEKETPLNFLDFLISRFVDLLLLGQTE